ncbi:hypothetical protein P4O66_000777 [Electrophorus voltai]|uniref:Sema domain-containing protein n=1 Tax=Electrophorus voltai TaxID=2609070 RepID=A0AAD8ZHE3_9TELE|nr:hypothetical protein P4O66_000777 [Electrophorus voltai]
MGPRRRHQEAECQNYIRVLLVNKTEVMTCGTNAFQPLCITREVVDFIHKLPSFWLFCLHPPPHPLRPQVGNLSNILERVNGVARCPYDPRHNSTAVVTESGELYAATVIDFSGRDPVIYRSLGGLPPLRTAQYNSKWLNGMNPALSLWVLRSRCGSCALAVGPALSLWVLRSR